MNTATVTHKRERKKYAERLEVRAACPICGHTAIIVFSGGEQEVYCPDRFCPNCKDQHDE